MLQEWIQEEKLVKFDHVHFLVMEPASYDMISYTQNDMTCRELEKNLWNEYLDIKLDDKAGHVLAYHWRKKKKDGVRINDFSCFAKINYQKMQMKTVLAYVLVILGLGILGSSIVSATSLINIYFSWAVNTYMIQNFGMDLGLSFLMIFIGWCLGRAK